MAEPGITVHAGAPTPGSSTVPPVRSSSPAKALSIADLVVTKSAVASRLRKDGEEFVSNVVEVASSQVFPMDIKVVPVRGSNFEARVLDNGTYAYALIFNETFTRRSAVATPTDTCIAEIVQRLPQLGVTSQLINCHVITKDMYDRFEQEGKAVFNSFAAADPKYYAGHGIELFTQPGKVLTVTSNLAEVIRYAETTTAANIGFADSGILGYIKDTTNKNPNRGIYGQSEPDRTDVFAVTGYVDFKTRFVAGGFGMQSLRIDPTYVITGIYSTIRTKEIALIALACAADRMIFQKGWVQAFTQFGTSTRNLGNLFRDAAGKPTPCKSLDDVNKALAKGFLDPNGSLVNPLLAIDLQEGCDQFPGLREILSNPDLVKAGLSAFTGCNAASGYNITQGEPLVYFDGLVDTPNGKVDTRSIDYMYLVDRNGGKLAPSDVDFLLNDINPKADPTAPRRKIDFLESNCYPGKIDVLYTTWRVDLNPNFVKGVLSDLASQIPLNWEDRMVNNTYDRSGLARFDSVGVPTFMSAGGPAAFSGNFGFQY